MGLKQVHGVTAIQMRPIDFFLPFRCIGERHQFDGFDNHDKSPAGCYNLPILLLPIGIMRSKIALNFSVVPALF